MARKAITNDVYDSLLSAYRADPGNYTNAAKAASCAFRTAKKAWESGWPSQQYPAIVAVLEEEKKQSQIKIRAELAAKRASEEKERDDAVRQALDARKQEGQMVQLTRVHSVQLLTVAVQLAQGARALAPALKQFIEVEAEKLQAWSAYEKEVMAGAVDPKDKSLMPLCSRPALTTHSAMMLLQRVAAMNNQISHTARECMEMERLHLGEPTNLIAIAATSREMTVDEAEARMEAAQEAWFAMQRNNGAMTLDAGIDEPEVGELVEDV